MSLRCQGELHYQGDVVRHNGCGDVMPHPWGSPCAAEEALTPCSRYLRQDPQSGIHGCLPILLFSQPFSLCPNFLRPVSLESTHVPLSLNSVVPSHPLTFCSTCSDLLGVLPGTCFPTYDLVHPSEIKHSPVFWGLPLASFLAKVQI